MENMIITKDLSQSIMRKEKAENLFKSFRINWKMLQFNYYSLIVVTLLVSTMIGSAAAMFVLQNNAPLWQLMACVIVSMVSNTASISNLSIKPVALTFIVSVLVNGALIFMNI
jgi:hypothetical protein